MTGTGFKIPPVVLAVFIAGEVAMFGGGYLLGSALASGDGEGEKKSTTSNSSPAGEEDEMRRQIQSLQEDLKASGERVTELDTKLKQAHLDIKEANRRAIESGEASFADNRQRDAAAAEMNSKLDALNLELMREKQRYAELEAIAFPGKPSLAFGKWADMVELKSSNWKEAGAAAAALTSTGISKLMEHFKSGKDWNSLDPQVLDELQNQSLKLNSLAEKFNGKTPTHASTAQGSFGHPILQFNLLAAALADVGLPLSESQLAELARIGEEYDARYDAAQSSYTAETPAVKMLVDELEYKMTASEAMERALTDAQRKAAFPEGTRHLLMLDAYSPTVILSAHVAPLNGISVETVKEQLKTMLTSVLGFPAESVSGQDAIIDQYFKDCEPILTPKPATAMSSFYTAPDVLVAGRAQVKLMHALISMTRPGSDALKVILSSKKIMLPVVSKLAE